MLNVVHLDFETRSEVDLRGDESVGLWNYANHSSTRALMLAWAIGESSVSLWDIAQGKPIPHELEQSLNNPEVMCAAWNSPFERHIFRYVLKRDIPISRWLDPQASARYLSLPDDLETAAIALNLPLEFRKDKRGEHLINVFSKLTVPRKARAKKGVAVEQLKSYFRDYDSDPLLWYDFGNYCIQDVEAEREIARRLQVFGTFPLPERERRIWELDQKINDFGMPTDRNFVRKNFFIGTTASDKAVEKLKELTGLENPKSQKQMLAWVRDRGYEDNTLRKEYVTLALDDPSNGLIDEARQVLELRKTANSTSYKKLTTIERQLSPDDRLKNQFIYMGSSRAGRFSSGAAQLHNLTRPTGDFEKLKNLDLSRELIYAGDYDGLEKAFKEPMQAVKSNIRSCFVAPKGKKLVVADLNAIETRVGAWLAGCHSLLSVFARPHGDPYLEFASKMTGISYEDLDRDIHSKDDEIKAVVKAHRQKAKVGVLQCVYRAGPGGWGHNKYGDPIKTGLLGSATNMGIKITQEQAQEIVHAFRDSYGEIVQLWYTFENCVRDVLKGPKKATASLGPDGCVKFDKINRKGQNPILRIQLPSGRYLHYVNAHLEDVLMPWKKKDVVNGKIMETDVYRPTLVYAGVNADTKQWETHTTSHGGKLTENVVQAIARDVLAEGMLRADAEGARICGHVHDELLVESADDPFDFNHKDLERAMSEPMSWAPSLPLAADGFDALYYRKG